MAVRAVDFDAIPFGPLDELMYSNENGYLDAYVLTARPEEFKDEYEAWMAANPGQAAEFERGSPIPSSGRRPENGKAPRARNPRRAEGAPASLGHRGELTRPALHSGGESVDLGTS